LTPQRRVVVVGAGFGGGHESVAEAIADALRRHRGARVRVASLDLLARCAPRSAQLAAIAYRGGEEYFPDGTGTLATMVAAAPEDPLLRELVTGGIASARAALDALEPDIVIAAHPVAGAIAAEVSERCGFVVVSVVGDLWPQRLWVHPAVRLYFVGGTPARDALTARGVEWARAVVSGVPVSGPPGRAAARARLLPFEEGSVAAAAGRSEPHRAAAREREPADRAAGGPSAQRPARPPRADSRLLQR